MMEFMLFILAMGFILFVFFTKFVMCITEDISCKYYDEKGIKDNFESKSAIWCCRLFGAFGFGVWFWGTLSNYLVNYVLK